MFGIIVDVVVDDDVVVVDVVVDVVVVVVDLKYGQCYCGSYSEGLALPTKYRQR